MSIWILVLGCLVCSFGVFADDLLPFDETINIFQNPDSTAAIFASDATAGADSNLFAINDDLDPLVADCGPSIDQFQGRKARLRRETSCTDDPTFDSNLNLPTLDQVNPSSASPKQSNRPGNRKDRADALSILSAVTGGSFRLFDIYLKACVRTYQVCSSGNPQDVTIGIDGSATLFNSRDVGNFGDCLFPERQYCCDKYEFQEGSGCFASQDF